MKLILLMLEQTYSIFITLHYDKPLLALHATVPSSEQEQLCNWVLMGFQKGSQLISGHNI